MSTRREVIKRAIVSGATLALLTSCRGFSPSATNNVDRSAINRLRASLKGRLILPGDLPYETARRVTWWNPATDKYPSVIAQCAQPEDVARCIDFARQHGLTVAVRSGGHSALGWGTCDGGLVLDVSPMKDVAIDPFGRTSRSGAGVLAQDMVSAAARYGLAPVLGECGTVGIAGLTLGGGLGWLSGRYGATCDNLLSVDLTTTDSRAIIASEQTNPDLFWALRGGGGNFGVATSFQYRLQPLTQVLAGGFAFPFREARHVLRSYREFMETAPDALQALACLATGEERVVTVIVVYSGDSHEGESVVAKVRSFGTPMRDTVQRRAFTETFSLQPYGEFVPTAFSINKTTYLQWLSDEAIDASLERFAACPAGCTMGFDHYMHGQVCRVPPDATAFELRAPGALHVWISSGWNDPAAAATFMTWADDTWKLLQPYSGGRIYANYMSVEGDSAVKAAYGANYARLASTKKKYDPDNFLRLNQNIRPSDQR